MTSRLVLEYDGGGFAGWALQPGLRTIQGEVERALSVVLRRPVSVVVAGRTDTGVHASGQVCSYEGEAVEVRSLNALLPGDVAAVSCSQAFDGFDARRDATSRAYCYRVLARRARSPLEAGRVLWWPHAVEFSALEECASLLVGVHDFTAFTPTETEHVRFSREVFAAFWRCGGEEGGGQGGGGGRGGRGGGGREVEGGQEGGQGGGGGRGEGGQGGGGDRGDGGQEDGLLEFWIEADAFMRHMNRVLVGTMLEVAGGRRSVSGFADLLRGRPRSAAGPTAPAHGLYLVGVGYDGERVLGS